MAESNKHIDSIDEILRNLKKDPEYYNHAKEQAFSRFAADE